MKKIIYLASALIAIVICFVVAIAYFRLNAQGTPPGLMIVPSNLELVANPGDVITKTISLYNNDKTTVDIVPEVRNFTAQGEEGEVHSEHPLQVRGS